VSDTGNIAEIRKLSQVAILDIAFFADVFVLMGIIFIGLCNPDCSETAFDKRYMAASTSVPVAAIDHPDAEAFKIPVRLFFDLLG
jgi:hypothetical protein